MISNFEIQENMLDLFMEKINQFNKKVVKLNLKPLTVVKQEIFKEDKVKYFKCQLIGESPKISGWEFIATIQYLDSGNIINNISEENIPEYFKTIKYTCDHCNAKRNKKNYVIKNIITGEFKQIGETCIGDFIRSTNIKQIIWYIECFFKIKNQDFIFSDNQTLYFNVKELIARTNVLVNKYGWKSTTKAKEESELKNKYIRSTADLVRKYMDCNWIELPSDRVEFEQHQPTEKDFQEAERIIAVVNSLDGEYNDYIWNLQVILKEKQVENKNINLVCSAIAVYIKQQQDKNIKEHDSHHIGNIGDKIIIDVVVTLKKSYDTPYGIGYIYKFLSKEGNIFSWFTTKNTLELNAEYQIKGTVKGHNVFNKIEETILTRIKVIKSN